MFLYVVGSMECLYMFLTQTDAFFFGCKNHKTIVPYLQYFIDNVS